MEHSGAKRTAIVSFVIDARERWEVHPDATLPLGPQYVTRYDDLGIGVPFASLASVSRSLFSIKHYFRLDVCLKMPLEMLSLEPMGAEYLILVRCLAHDDCALFAAFAVNMHGCALGCSDSLKPGFSYWSGVLRGKLCSLILEFCCSHEDERNIRVRRSGRARTSSLSLEL